MKKTLDKVKSLMKSYPSFHDELSKFICEWEKNQLLLDPSDGQPTFDEFYDEYGYKVGKRDAIKAWKKLTPREKIMVMASLPYYLDDTLPVGTEKSGSEWRRFRKMPASYLNSHEWEDYYEMATTSKYKELYERYESVANYLLAESTPSQSEFDRMMDFLVDRGMDVGQAYKELCKRTKIVGKLRKSGYVGMEGIDLYDYIIKANA